MDYQKAKDELEKELSILETIRDGGMIEIVNHIDRDTIYFYPDVDVDFCRRRINKAFGSASDKLDRYYMSYCGNCLVTSYRNESVRSIYYSYNVESLLKKISNGKCKIVETVEPAKIVKNVVCEMEEES